MGKEWKMIRERVFCSHLPRVWQLLVLLLPQMPGHTVIIPAALCLPLVAVPGCRACGTKIHVFAFGQLLWACTAGMCLTGVHTSILLTAGSGTQAGASSNCWKRQKWEMGCQRDGAGHCCWSCWSGMARSFLPAWTKWVLKWQGWSAYQQNSFSGSYSCV